MKILQWLFLISVLYLLSGCQSVNKSNVIPFSEEEAHSRIKSLSTINNMLAALEKKDIKLFYSYIDTAKLFKSIHQQMNLALLKHNPNMKVDSFDYKILSEMGKSIAKAHLEPKRLLSYLSGSHEEMNKIEPFYSFDVGQPRNGREYILVKAQSIEPVKLTFESDINNDWKLVDINIRAEKGYYN